MSIVEQPLTVLAPASDTDEGLQQHPGDRGSMEDVTNDEVLDDGACRDLSTSLTGKDSTAHPSRQKETPVKRHAPTVYNELTPLVAMPPPSDAAVQSRLTKHRYSRLGRNLLFEARPAVRGGLHGAQWV